MTDADIAEESFLLLENDICFIGHTHSPGVFAKTKEGRIVYRADPEFRLADNEKYIVNVGSVGQPRDGDPAACYCVYDSAKNTVEIKRVKYDCQAAAGKILAAGLPRFLAERLLVGR